MCRNFVLVRLFVFFLLMFILLLICNKYLNYRLPD